MKRADIEGQQTVVRMLFGSHLYGTSTPASDIDYKEVVLPSAREILLGRTVFVSSTARPKGEGEKNYAGEEEREAFSLQKFASLAEDSQLVALDMLFAPPEMILESSPLWERMQRERDMFLSARVLPFIGYAQKQAAKYGIKGSRVRAARVALEYLEKKVAEYGPNLSQKLSLLASDIEDGSMLGEHSSVEDIPHPSGRQARHWIVCNRKMPYDASIRNAHDMMRRVVDEYGARALAAERNEAIEWKALSHAVRVGRQAVELLATGHMTMPRPEAAHLLAIKRGEMEYRPVAEEIERLMDEVVSAAEKSTLPQRPDSERVADFVAEAHHEVVMAESGWWRSRLG